MRVTIISRGGPVGLTNSGEGGEGQNRNKTSQGLIRLIHIFAGQFPKGKINQFWSCDRWGLFSAGQISQWDKFLVLSSASKESLANFWPPPESTIGQSNHSLTTS